MAIDLKDAAVRAGIEKGFDRISPGQGKPGLETLEKMMAGGAVNEDEKDFFSMLIGSLTYNIGLAGGGDGLLVPMILSSTLSVGKDFHPMLTVDTQWALLLGAIQFRTGLRVTCEANRQTWEKIIRYLITYGEGK